MVNTCIFIGNLGKDPEIRTLENGSRVASFSLATSESWKDKSGTKQTRTTWIDCEVWGPQVETIEKYVFKGSQLYIQSKLKVDEFEKEGQKRRAYKFIVNSFTMLGSKQDSQQSASSTTSGQNAPSFDEGEDDDLPF